MAVQRRDGFLFDRVFSLSISDAQDIFNVARDGDLYINLHSNDVPSGEIRGQVSLVQDDTPMDGGSEWQSELTGDQEVPVVETSAMGEAAVSIGSFFVGPGTTTIDVTVSLQVLGIDTDAARAMHFHDAPAGSNGGVVLNLDPAGALQADTPQALRQSGFEDLTVWLGDQAGNALIGDAGVDIMNGRRGPDMLKGNNNADVLIGALGNDTLNGGNGIDAIDGGNGVDRIFGGNGSDIIVGGGANDVINTGKGVDLVVYDLRDPTANGRDVILDFNGADGFVFVGETFSQTIYSRVDPTNEDAIFRPRSNAVVLTDEEMSAAEAQTYMAEQSDFTRDGIFTYYNKHVERVLLVYSEDLSDASAPTKVLARYGSDIDLLDKMQARDFKFLPDDIIDFG